MSFVYNENACTDIRDFFLKRLKVIQHDIAFLQGEVGRAKELAVQFALQEELNRRKFDESVAQIKIEEMEQILAFQSKG
ncbi:hypothetical protein [Ramlibacter sp. WS9]|uniref:hypothetical protein n=1 Tax=Ramlibacter sp. WS9 TaxID=1882741 RepID=UPI0011429D83|nr:hypothetical protein [Ramlibacter sp. WS9]ROZ72085.1 hypothetical protein EEB15_20110 [Ramlibacter sp. WS9]